MSDKTITTPMHTIAGHSIPNGTKIVAFYGDGSGARLFLIDDNRLDLVHIEAKRIPEKEDEEKGQGEGQIETPEVPKQVVDLLAGDRPDVPEVHADSPSFCLLTACGSQWSSVRRRRR